MGEKGEQGAERDIAYAVEHLSEVLESQYRTGALILSLNELVLSQPLSHD